MVPIVHYCHLQPLRKETMLVLRVQDFCRCLDGGCSAPIDAAAPQQAPGRADIDQSYVCRQSIEIYLTERQFYFVIFVYNCLYQRQKLQLIRCG